VLNIDLKTLSGVLTLFKKNDPNYYSHLIAELKIKLSYWQRGREINTNNCPEQLKEVLTVINEILENGGNHWRGWKKSEGNNEEGQVKRNEELAKIIIEIKLMIAELTKDCKIKFAELDPQFNNWEKKLMDMESVSEAKEYQQQLRKKLQEEKMKHSSPVTNENKSSLSVKIVLGIGIVIFLLGTVVMAWQIIKNKKAK
jgi:hypothetical protein